MTATAQPSQTNTQIQRTCFRCGECGHETKKCINEPQEAGRIAYRCFLARRKEFQANNPKKTKIKSDLHHFHKLIEWMKEEHEIRDPVKSVNECKSNMEKRQQLKRNLHHSYRESFDDIMKKIQERFCERLGASTDTPLDDQSGDTFSWQDDLNRAVKEGSPADFSRKDAIRVYAVERLAARCRQLHHLIMDDNSISANIRALLLPAKGSTGKKINPLSVCSIGGGPGYDHVAISIVAYFLYRVQSHHVTQSSDLSSLQPKAIKTRVFDLYDSEWLDVMNVLVESCQGLDEEEANGNTTNHNVGRDITMHHTDLRLALEAPNNQDLYDNIPSADIICFQFVMHENTSFLLKDDGSIGGSISDILRFAKLGAFIICTDSGNFLWPALKRTATSYGWSFIGNAEKDHNISFGPKSFVILERTENRENGVIVG